MKKLALIAIALLTLTGCVTRDQLYYDASKAISKDSTVIQSACFAAVGEIAKDGDNAAKIAAIALSEKCKLEAIKLEPPKRNIFGF